MSAESQFSRLWLCSAALVSVLRFLDAATPGYDLGFQIQAAQNLLAGNGLSFYDHTGPNLTDPASLVTITNFSAGYSLAAAPLMALGLSVAFVVKVLGAAGTLLGWWGWSKLAARFFWEGMKRNVAWKWAGFAIATSTPLLFTPPWGGTDIFLWATVPWVVVGIVRPPIQEHVSRTVWVDVRVGVLCGFALLMRYASVFVVGFAACVILWQSRLRIAELTRRFAAFGLGVLPAVSLQLYVNFFLSTSPKTPGGMSFDVGLAANDAARLHAVGRRLLDGVSLLHTANYAWSFWVPGKVATLLFPGMTGSIPWQLGITLVGFIFLVMFVKTEGASRTASSGDPRIMALGLFVAVPLTLLGSMMLGSYNYVGDQRYYWPLVPLSVFVAYAVASATDISENGRVLGLLRAPSLLYLTGYIALSLVFVIFLLVPGGIGTSQREKLLASDPLDWPSMAVKYELSPARRFVIQRLKEEPKTLLLSSRVGYFHWDPLVDRYRVAGLNCEGLRATYLSGPTRIIIYTFDVGDPKDLWYFVGIGSTSGIKRSDCFERLGDRKVLQRFPEEGVKVLEARVAAGRQVILKP